MLQALLSREIWAIAFSTVASTAKQLKIREFVGATF